jgi:hypothetical protein
VWLGALSIKTRSEQLGVRLRWAARRVDDHQTIGHVARDMSDVRSALGVIVVCALQAATVQTAHVLRTGAVELP